MRENRVWVAIVAAVLLIGAAPAMAQVRLGAVVDVNFANVSSDDPESEDLVSTYMRLGVGGVLEYGINERLSLVTEPMLLGKGSKGDVTEEGVTVTVKVKLSYFELPLLAKYAFGEEGAARPYLLGGPTIGFKSGAKAVWTFQGVSETEDISEDVKATDLGFGFGGGVSLPVSSGRAFVEALYVIGLADIDEDEYSSTKNKGPQVRFGITFPIGSK